MNPTLSIIVPAYNEQARIAESLRKIVDFTHHWPADAEILVVDDGSSDATAECVQSAIEADPASRLRLIRYATNRGKGAAVQTGFRAARHDIVLFTDVDLSAPLSEVAQLIRPIVDGDCEIAVGSRAIDPSRIDRSQGWIRRQSGRLFHLAVRAITGVRVRDTQCGFKAFDRKACEPLFALQRLERFAFDVELLYLAAQLGLRVCELPVRWRHVDLSTVQTLRDGRRMVFDLFRIRWNDWIGRYASSDDEAGIE